MKPQRRAVSIRLRADLLEALDETAKEIVVSRNRLIEHAVEEYLSRLELPERAA